MQDRLATCPTVLLPLIKIFAILSLNEMIVNVRIEMKGR